MTLVPWELVPCVYRSNHSRYQSPRLQTVDCESLDCCDVVVLDPVGIRPTDGPFRARDDTKKKTHTHIRNGSVPTFFVWKTVALFHHLVIEQEFDLLQCASSSAFENKTHPLDEWLSTAARSPSELHSPPLPAHSWQIGSLLVPSQNDTSWIHSQGLFCS